MPATPITNRHVTALWFNLNLNLNLKASTLLLSYRSLYLTALYTDKLYTNTPTDRQALYRHALRTDKSRAATPTNLITVATDIPCNPTRHYTNKPTT